MTTRQGKVIGATILAVIGLFFSFVVAALDTWNMALVAIAWVGVALGVMAMVAALSGWADVQMIKLSRWVHNLRMPWH